MAAAALAAVTVGCGTTRVTVDDPLADIRNPRLGDSRRVQAIQRAWAQGQDGSIDRVTVREELKNVAWSSSWPQKMRMEALRALASDTSERGREDTRQNVVKLMLPREPDPVATRFLAEVAVSNGWSDATPALIRSLSRRWADVPDAERPEYRAIAALNPGRSVQEVVYEVFLNPPQETGIFGFVPAEKVRADAWDLLARVDPDGTARAALILDAEAGETGPIADMRASLEQMRCLPLTGDELQWLSQLRDFSQEKNRAWWEQTAAAVGTLDRERARKLQLRHLEPIRWASVHRPEWLKATREELLSELARTVEPRRHHRRRRVDTERWRPAPERLRDWESKMSWADALTVLVVDEALRAPGVAAALLAQAEMDREDKGAEYGGLLRVDGGAGGRDAVVVLYPPRPGQRRSDREFVASSDMFAQGAHALAHYHFHAQDRRNGEYAGPSADDQAYAARSGRTCLVLTSVAEGVLNADYYQPDGVTLDLGEIRQ